MNNKPHLNTMLPIIKELKMNRILLTLILGLFLISFISAESIGTFKQNQNVTLPQLCSTCTYINITSITYPNGSLIISNIAMTKDGSYFTYNLTNDYTTTLGTYGVNGIGNDVDCSASGCVWAYTFEITPNGLSQSTSQGIGSAIFLVLMIILMFVFGFLGFKLFKTENLWILGIFFMFLSGMFLVYNTWLGYEYHRLFTGLTDSSIPETIFYIFLLVLVLGSLTTVALLILNWKKVFRYIKQEIKRKESDDKDTEDWDMDSWGGKDFGK